MAELVELLPPIEPLTYIDALVCRIQPQECSKLIKQLAEELPLGTLGHLKRVRRSKKRPRDEETTLEVVLGDANLVAASIVDQLGISGVYKVQVPARPATSKDEWRSMQAIWPTSAFHEHTEPQLSDQELDYMRRGIQQAITDSCTLILSPETGEVVARSSTECHHGHRNPLQTPVIQAIQAVSRLERQVAENAGMTSDSFQKGQYLCTGYDVFTKDEPSVYEAMALVHARVRRVVFQQAAGDGSGGFLDYTVHALPGTNHRYRVFQLR